MASMTIDGKQISVSENETVYEAAQKLGIPIPTLCRGPKSIGHFNSCMLCIVKEKNSGRIIPSCSTCTADGMEIETESQEIFALRHAALELLLSEHTGDCEGPCSIFCPASMDIPLMIKMIKNKRIKSAVAVVFRSIPFPSVLGRICPAPCEKICRRLKLDASLSICMLKRFVGDAVLLEPDLLPDNIAVKTNKKVAVIGSGPAGMSAAYYLSMSGADCTMFEKNRLPGGTLQYSISDSVLEKRILNLEIANILKAGIRMETEKAVGKEVPLSSIVSDFDAVLVCTGTGVSGADEFPELEKEAHGIKVDADYRTNMKNVFAAGGAVRHMKMAVKAVAEGRAVAESATAFLVKGMHCTARSMNSKIRHLKDNDIRRFMNGASEALRTFPSDPHGGFSLEEAVSEAGRCFQCQCRKKDKCRLRDYSTLYGARQILGKGSSHVEFIQLLSEKKGLVFEPGKCVKCGICVRISRKNNEKFGLAFSRKGFNTTVKVPLSESIENAFSGSADEYIVNCPTGALSSLR